MTTNNFGTCCKDLSDAMTSAPQKSTFNIMEENGVLYLGVGYMQTTDGRIGWFEQAVIYCPFCGKKLQDKEEIKESSNS